MGLQHLNNVKVMLTLWTLNYVAFLFLTLILSILFTVKPTNLKKPYSQISEKHDQTPLIDYQIKPDATSEMELFVIKNRQWLETAADCCYTELRLTCHKARRSDSTRLENP